MSIKLTLYRNYQINFYVVTTALLLKKLFGVIFNELGPRPDVG